jgi:cyclic beta-1,2-glucan synthetase
MAPHIGRGGWTWYTGSASWMYRAGLESILGFHLQGQRLTLAPCIPHTWREYEIHYRHASSTYRIFVKNPDGICTDPNAVVLLDGEILAGGHIPLKDDGQQHTVIVTMHREPVDLA